MSTPATAPKLSKKKRFVNFFFAKVEKKDDAPPGTAPVAAPSSGMAPAPPAVGDGSALGPRPSGPAPVPPAAGDGNALGPKPSGPAPVPVPPIGRGEKLKELGELQESKLNKLVDHTSALKTNSKASYEVEKGTAVDWGEAGLNAGTDLSSIPGGGIGAFEGFESAKFDEANPASKGDYELPEGVEKAAKAFGSIEVIKNGIATIKNIVGLIMKLAAAIKNRKDGVSGPSKAEWADEIIQTIKNACKTVASSFSFVEKFAKAVPIIGAVIGAVDATMEFVTHVSQVVSAGKGKYRMGKLKGTQTAGLHEKHRKAVAAAPAGTAAPAKPRYLLAHRKKDGGDDEQIDRYNARTRVKELKTKEENGAELSEAEQTELDELQEYLLTHEIGQADKKRLVQGGLDITADVVNFTASLAGLDPTIGSAVGVGLSGAVTVGQLGHKIGRFFHQKIRDYRGGKKVKAGATGDAYEKAVERTTKGKEERRDSLGSYMVDKIHKLKEHDIDSMDETTPADKFDKAAGDYKTVKDQIFGMGVMYSLLLRTKNIKSLEGLFAKSLSREGASDKGMVSSIQQASGH